MFGSSPASEIPRAVSAADERNRDLSMDHDGNDSGGSRSCGCAGRPIPARPLPRSVGAARNGQGMMPAAVLPPVVPPPAMQMPMPVYYSLYDPILMAVPPNVAMLPYLPAGPGREMHASGPCAGAGGDGASTPRSMAPIPCVGASPSVPWTRWVAPRPEWRPNEPQEVGALEMGVRPGVPLHLAQFLSAHWNALRHVARPTMEERNRLLELWAAHEDTVAELGRQRQYTSERQMCCRGCGMPRRGHRRSCIHRQCPRTLCWCGVHRLLHPVPLAPGPECRGEWLDLVNRATQEPDPTTATNRT